MSEAAAPAAPAAPATPAAAPSNGAAPPTNGAAPAQGAQPTAEQVINLYEAPDNARVMLRVNGRDVAMTAAEARRTLQNPQAANERYNAAAREKRETQELVRNFTAALDSPERLRDELSALGRNPGEIARALMELEIAEAGMTPEQKRLRELERDHRQLLAQRERQQQMAQQQEVQNHAQAYDREFTKAIEAAGVPPSPRIRMVVTHALVSTMERVLQHNAQIKDQRRHVRLTPADLADVARKAYDEHATDYRQHLSRDHIRAAITDDDIAWYHEQRKMKPRPTQAAAPQQPNTQDDHYRDRRGRFVNPERAANKDLNGRTIVPSGSFADMFEARRKALGM